MQVTIVCGTNHQDLSAQRNRKNTWGGWLAQCSCGWIGPAYPSEDDARRGVAAHRNQAMTVHQFGMGVTVDVSYPPV